MFCFHDNRPAHLLPSRCPPAGDFLVGGAHLFEVGGKRKSFAQIKDLPNSYLAVDGLEVGYGNRIPL